LDFSLILSFTQYRYYYCRLANIERTYVYVRETAAAAGRKLFLAKSQQWRSTGAADGDQSRQVMGCDKICERLHRILPVGMPQSALGRCFSEL